MDLVITQPPFVMTLREGGKLKCENHQMALIDLFSNPSDSINVFGGRRFVYISMHETFTLIIQG